MVASTEGRAATEISAPPGRAWKHQPTGIELPTTLVGMQRSRLAYFSAPEVDVAGSYHETGGDTVTVYLYRNVAGSVPVWFDRARFFILNLPDQFGSPTATGIRPFTPRGQAVSSGLIELYEVSGKARSTGLMVFPIKGFFAKIRATSSTRDAASLEKLMIDAANAFDWSSKTASLPASPLGDCPSPFGVMRPAKEIPLDAQGRMTAGLLGGLLSQVTSERTDKKLKPLQDPPIAYCREPGAATLSYGTYRQVASNQHYLLAILDGGRAVTVVRNGFSEIVNAEASAGSGKTTIAQRFTVSQVDLDKVATFADFETLPPPSQAIEQVENGTPVSVASTWGKKRDVNIFTQ